MSNPAPLAILDDETRQELRDLKIAHDVAVQIAQAMVAAANQVIAQFDANYATTLKTVLRQNRLDAKAPYAVDLDSGEISNGSPDGATPDRPDTAGATE